MKKDYNKRTIRDEISYKIKTIDATRHNRIFASKRLYRYSQRWEVVFFSMNILAVIFLISSTVILTNSKLMTLVSGCFSLYTIITQYYYNNLNYRERGLKFHYLELDLEHLIVKLKTLLRDKNKSNLELEREYKFIMNNYICSLKGYENHEEIDNKEREIREEIDNEEQENCEEINNKKREDKSEIRHKEKIKDYSSDNIFYYGNICIILLFVILYIIGIWEYIFK